MHEAHGFSEPACWRTQPWVVHYGFSLLHNIMVLPGSWHKNYHFDRRLVELAGWWCYAEAFRRLQHYDRIAVPNVFVSVDQIFGYVEQSRKLQIKVTLLEANTPWAKDPVECFKHCKMGAPLEAIQRMARFWDEINQKDIDEELYQAAPTGTGTGLPNEGTGAGEISGAS